MDGRLEINFDKKKTIFENVYSIYDSLFDKNISVHKAISKFVFSSCGLGSLIAANAHKNQKSHNHRKFVSLKVKDAKDRESHQQPGSRLPSSKIHKNRQSNNTNKKPSE